MPKARVLCVDDDPQIQLMLPQILKLHGYEVTTAGTVPDALNLITSQSFNVLVADLNMGHVADGFTVVSAMRRVNPDCINLILTGYPALESALQALRSQVDDYLTKPSDIPKLMECIERKLSNRGRRTEIQQVRLSAILRSNAESIVARSLVAMKDDRDLSAVPLSDEQRTSGLADDVLDVADHLDSNEPNEANAVLLRSARLRGEMRRSQGYSVDLLVQEERVLEQVLNNVIYENLIRINLSFLLLDLGKLNDALLMQLKESIRTHVRVER